MIGRLRLNKEVLCQTPYEPGPSRPGLGLLHVRRHLKNRIVRCFRTARNFLIWPELDLHGMTGSHCSLVAWKAQEASDSQEPPCRKLAFLSCWGEWGEPCPSSLISLQCQTFALFFGLFCRGGQSCHFLADFCVVSLCLAWLTLQSPVRFLTEISTYLSPPIKLFPSSMCLEKSYHVIV